VVASTILAWGGVMVVVGMTVSVAVDGGINLADGSAGINRSTFGMWQWNATNISGMIGVNPAAGHG
jgi:hypothetical protein